MASVSIKVRPGHEEAVKEGRLLAGYCYEILIDGREIRHMTEFSIAMPVDGAPRVTVDFFVDRLDIDAVALASLQAYVREQTGI